MASSHSHQACAARSRLSASRLVNSLEYASTRSPSRSPSGRAPRNCSHSPGKVLPEAVVQPVDLRGTRRGYRCQHHLGDTAGVPFGIGQRQRRTPRVAVDEPSFDAEVCPDPFDIRHQATRRVRLKVGPRVTRVGRTSAAVPLVEQHNAVRRGVEEAPVPGRTTGTGAPVEHHCRLPVRVAACLPVQRVAVAGRESVGLVGLDVWVEAKHEECMVVAWRRGAAYAAERWANCETLGQPKPSGPCSPPAASASRGRATT